MERTPWVLRTFPEINDNGVFPCLLERLEGTPARLYEKVSRLNKMILDDRPAKKWSIKKQIGHLTDLEPLWMLSIDQINSSLPQMKPADMTNAKTWMANHDEKDVEELLFGFKQARQQTMMKLKSLEEADLLKSSSLHG